MLIRDYIIGFIAFTLLTIGGVVLIGALIPNNPDFTEHADYYQFNKSFTRLADIQRTTEALESSVSGAEPDTEDEGGWFSSLISTSWNTLKLIPKSFKFILTTLNEIPTYFGFADQAWIFTLIISMITVAIAFTILAAIFRRDV